jgi:hypothetical protein
MKRIRILGWIIFGMLILLGIGSWLFLRNFPIVRNAPYVSPIFSPTPLLVNPSPTPLASANVIVFSPYAGQTVGPDFIIEGKARVFENVVSIKLKNFQSDDIYLMTTTQTRATDAGVFGDFMYPIHLSTSSGLTTDTKLQLDVYQASPKDGSPIDVVSVPLLYQLTPPSP